MKRFLILLTLSSLVSPLSSLHAQVQREYTPSPVQGSAWNTPGNINPIIPGYFADPTIRKFGDTYYIYATTDGTGNGYGPAQVWMSKDFVNWKNCVMNWPNTEVVWAPDVVQQPDGKYRYYYCEPCNVNIGESDSPIGPWKNILGNDDAVMVPDRYIHNVITLDPMLFKDDDGSQYLYFTTWGIYKGFGCGVAKLKDGDYDVSALASKYKDARHWNENDPFPIAADEFFTEKKLILNDELKDIFEAPFVFKKDGIYYFTYSSGSCHTDTYRVQYATSKIGPMGPWEYKGELLTTNEDGTVHGPGHHSILEVDGKYYIVYHRHNNPKSIHGFNRQVCIDKLEFEANGDIKKIIPTHDGINPLLESLKGSKGAKGLKGSRGSNGLRGSKAIPSINLAYGAKVTASSYYDDWFKPEYAVDDNNATLWKARNTNWGNPSNPNHAEWLTIDLGKDQYFNEIWTQFEYATFFYQYKIETSSDNNQWTMFADRTDSLTAGSPMIDKKASRARYIRITITDTQKNGHMPAIWNVKVWQNAPVLPDAKIDLSTLDRHLFMKDVVSGKHMQGYKAIYKLDVDAIAAGKDKPFDVSELQLENGDASSTFKFTANKPIHARVKDGKWGLFFNGTQCLTSENRLMDVYRYNSPYTIAGWFLSTKVGPVSTVVSLSPSRKDLATTEFRLGTDPSTGLLNHNGSFESSGAAEAIKQGEGKWQFWVVTYDGWMERVYLNGKLLQEKNNFLMVRPEGRITIGADGTGANNFMGYINSLVVLPYAVTDNEVEQIYNGKNTFDTPSLGDDTFEEIDPESKFCMNPKFKKRYQSKDVVTLSTDKPNFNDAPLHNGAEILKEVKGDFVMMATIDDMEGLSTHSVKGYNEGGIIIANGYTYYQYGAFPLYNCGNMLTVLSPAGRPQYPNYKGYKYDKYIQYERRGNQLFARSSADGKTWENSPGSPIDLTSDTLQLGIYQTTYSDTQSWIKLKDIQIWY